MNTLEIIRLANCPPMPWRNGGGSMQLIATHPPEATAADFDWRISVAQVVQDSPFSAFPGYDRCIALLSGNGMVLSSPENQLEAHLKPHSQPFSFAGETTIHARLIDGPLSNLSVLVRHGLYRIELSCLYGPIELALPKMQTPVLIHCISGAIQMASPRQASWHIGGSEFVLWRVGSPEMTLTSARDDTRVALIKLCQLNAHTPSAANASRTAAT